MSDKFLTKAGREQVCVMRSRVVNAARAVSRSTLRDREAVQWNYGVICGVAVAARALGLEPDDVGIMAWPNGSIEEWHAACAAEQARRAEARR